MKRLLGTALLLLMSSVSVMTFANTAQTERMLKGYTLNGKREFSGNFEGTDDFTLSHQGKLVFRSIQDQLVLTMVSNGNRHAWRSNLVYPRSASVKYFVENSNPESTNQYQTYDIELDGELYEISLEPKTKTFYVVESDSNYDRRMKQLAELGRHYEVTGKFIGVAEFSPFGVDKIDFYEIIPEKQEVEDEQEQQQNTIKNQKIILRGTFSETGNRHRRNGHWGRTW